MLNDKDLRSRPAAAGTPAPPGSTLRTAAFIGPGSTIKGELEGAEDLTIDGKLEGAISLDGQQLIVGSTAHIQAPIIAREVVVAGKVIGNIIAPDRIELRKGASVVGNLTTARLAIEDGAYFKGAIEIGRSNTEVRADLEALLARAREAQQKLG